MLGMAIMDYADLTADKAILLAFEFLNNRKLKVTKDMPSEAHFVKADKFTKYDRWVVYFETHPRMDPSITVVEILQPNWISRWICRKNWICQICQMM
jgi:hypothetical protein